MSWNFRDPFPDRRLSEIFPLSDRAVSWFARAWQDSKFPRDRAVQVRGGALMLGGLDYHHDNLVGLLENQLASYYRRHAASLNHMRNGNATSWVQESDAEQKCLQALDHEAFAYINRLGQFHTFVKKGLGLEALMPRISELMIFRNKHTAHRSIDDPWKEDHPQLQEAHAMVFGFYRYTVASFPVFQIHDEQGTNQEFHMRKDHPIVMQEALNVLQAFYPVSE